MNLLSSKVTKLIDSTTRKCRVAIYEDGKFERVITFDQSDITIEYIKDDGSVQERLFLKVK